MVQTGAWSAAPASRTSHSTDSGIRQPPPSRVVSRHGGFDHWDDGAEKGGQAGRCLIEGNMHHCKQMSLRGAEHQHQASEGTRMDLIHPKGVDNESVGTPRCKAIPKPRPELAGTPDSSLPELVTGNPASNHPSHQLCHRPLVEWERLQGVRK